MGAYDPIYWVQGPKVVDSYADLYDGSWDYTGETGQYPRTEAGASIVDQWEVWTGTTSAGASDTGNQLGSDTATRGKVNTAGEELDSGDPQSKSGTKFLYGISPVLTVDKDPAGPARPTGLTALAKDQAARLSWDEPRDENPSVDKRQVQYRSRSRASSSDPWGVWGAWGEWTDMFIMSSNNPPRKIYYVGAYNVNGLTNGNEYQFRIRAVSGTHYSAPSASAETIPQGKPEAPTGLIANSADQSVILHWDQVDNDQVTAYQFRSRPATGTWADAGAAWTAVPESDDDTTTHVVDRLANMVSHVFQVRAGSTKGWGAASAKASATPEAPSAAPAAVSVAHDWALIPMVPDGKTPNGKKPAVTPGQKFRLLFVTKGMIAATSTKINDYNKFVQDQAALNNSLSPYKAGFRAVISTAAVDARDNTRAVQGQDNTADDVVPVYLYWVGGDQAVRTLGDLYEDDDWLDGARARNQSGDHSNANQVWTGSFRNGTLWSFYEYRYHAGAKTVRVGDPTKSGNHIHRDDDDGIVANSFQLPLYGISPVLIVQQPPSQ